MSGRYVFIEEGTMDESGVLIDARTGTRVELTPPAGCNFSNGTFPSLGGSWIVAECSLMPGRPGDPLELYNIPARTWVPFNPDLTSLVALDPDCKPVAEPPDCSANYIAIGDRWIEFEVTRGYHRGVTTNAFEQIRSGQVSATPPGVTPGGNRILDLNSQSLTQTLCDPLRLPSAGTIIPDDGFAIEKEDNFNGSGYLGRKTFLERCGSSLHRSIGLIGSFFGANAHAVVWAPGVVSDEVDGLLLPSLRRLTLRLPGPVASLCHQVGSVCVEGLALTSRTLYVSASNFQVWATGSPLRPAASETRTGR